MDSRTSRMASVIFMPCSCETLSFSVSARSFSVV